jgi:anaerobic magnesium-protoporphyrin IX monomethyl ester cyclase
MSRRILFSATYSSIEPLGLLHLAGLARDMGWERKFSLVKNHDFTKLLADIKEFRPDVVGFNIYTGAHLQVFKAIDEIKKRWPWMRVAVGGPHPTYFPMTASKHADYVVMSEGFDALRKILLNEVDAGVIPYTKSAAFPQPDRKKLYADYPEFAASKIKSMIGMTGCPYRCTYCYNSSTPDDIKVTPEIAQQIAKSMGMAGRLFPFNVRAVDDLITEGRELVENWQTSVIAFVDDVHGFDTKVWMPEMGQKWRSQVGIPYHAQMRWEMVNGDGGKRRLDQMVAAGGFALTLAIESSDEQIRKEVLDRATPEDLMFNGMANIRERGMKVRTEQITALPYGATAKPTMMNLAMDIDLIRLNVALKPDMSWASTFAPYAGTKLGQYADRHGHYMEPENPDVPDTFFERSVLRFPKEWVGSDLKSTTENAWLEGDELNDYRDRNAALRRHFNLLCLLPEGDKVAARFLASDNHDFSAQKLCEVAGIESYFAPLPFGEMAKKKHEHYISMYGDTPNVLSNAVRHHLYDEVLYQPRSA